MFFRRKYIDINNFRAKANKEFDKKVGVPLAQLTKIFIFWPTCILLTKIFIFWPKFIVFVQNSYFWQTKFYFWTKFLFVSNITIFTKIPIFYKKFLFLTKIYIFDNNFWTNLFYQNCFTKIVLSKFMLFNKIYISAQIFGNLWKISVFGFAQMNTQKRLKIWR